MGDCKAWQNAIAKAIHSTSKTEHGSPSLSGIIEPERAKLLERTILQSLHFPEMAHRHDRIAEAYSKTFRWIYRDPRSEDKPWASFTDWLEHDSTLYWITGKAGSGKSTLMKYIYHNERTLKHLAKWSPDNAPLTAAFFFWSSGSSLQMSHDGLLRSLLFQLLKQCPALIPSILPERWEVYNLFGSDSLSWTQEELTQGFKLLAKEKKHRQKTCVFIDGLDEFDENHSSLIDILKEVSSSSHIKICVSSRPWITFEDAFKHSPNLMLENLTYPDIKYFVYSRFNSSPDFTRLKALEPGFASVLLETIIQKAAGVFLWVNLVVHSLLAGLINADRIVDLQKRLDFLPPDLENLYEKILNDLDPFYFEHASQYFRLVRASPEPPTLLCMFFADEEPESFQTYKAQILDNEEEQLRADVMRRRINSRCKGLLEVSPGYPKHRHGDSEMNWFKGIAPSNQKHHSSMFSSSPDSTVQYLHKTVKDFLESPKVWFQLLEKNANEYNPHLALCRSFVLQLKCINRAWNDNSSILYFVRRCLQHVCSIQEAGDDGALAPDLVAILDELDCAATELAQSPGLTFQDWPRPLHVEFGVRTFLSLTVRLGFNFYIEQKVNRGCLVVDDTETWPLLADAITMNETLIRHFGCSALVNVKMVNLLLSRGADPNQKCGSETIWQRLLDNMHGRTYPKLEDMDVQIPIWIDIVLLFLQHGADRTVGLLNLSGTALRHAPPEKAKEVVEMLHVPFYKRFTRAGRKYNLHKASLN